MKKFIALLLALAMVLSLTACSQTAAPEETLPAATEATVAATEEILPETTAAPTTTANTTVANTQATEPPETEPPTTAHVHSYTATLTDPTCTEKGYTTHACACGDSYTASEVDALGHSY